MPHNRPVNHVAISCTDLDGLVDWYTSVLGFETIGKVQHFNRDIDPTPFDTIFVSYPPTLQELKFAILTSGNGVGIECFQFIQPSVAERPRSTHAFDFTQPGFFHICVTDPDPESLVKKACEAGGRTVGGWMDYSRYGLIGHHGIYMQDPWMNVIEVMSLSLERVSSAGLGMYFALTKPDVADQSDEKANL